MEGARPEFVKAYAAAASSLRNLQVVEEEKEKIALDDLVAQAQEEVRGVIDKPWRSFPEVQEFENQFEPERKLKRRKVLVLDGKSGCGKTEFAMSMVPEGRAIEINCANCTTEPPLQGLYRPLEHDLILCDEMHVQLLLNNKRLFQGPATKVVLGSSQTNKFTYQAFVFRKRFVICSNKWKKQLKKVSKTDREWINKNTIYLKVTRPMWRD